MSSSGDRSCTCSTRSAMSSTNGSSMADANRVGSPSTAYDRQRARRVQRALDPAGHDDVGQVDHVVAVDVGDEQCVQLVCHGPGLGETDHGATACVELQRDLAVANEHAGAGPTRGRVGHTGAGEGDGRGGHRRCCVSMPRSRTSEPSSWPKQATSTSLLTTPVLLRARRPTRRACRRRAARRLRAASAAWRAGRRT